VWLVRSIMRKIEFTVYPLMAYPLRGFFSLVMIVLFTALSYILVKHIVMPIFTFLIICMPIVNFIFPSKYILEDEGFKKIQLFQEKKMGWNQFASYLVTNDGVLLISKLARRYNEYIYIFDKPYFIEIEELLNAKGIVKYANG